MAVNPTVSQFTLQQQPQSQISHLNRARNRFQRSQRIHHLRNHISSHLKQVIIDVSLNEALKISSHPQKQQEEDGDIRNHVDACLNAIEAAYNQKKVRLASSKTYNEPILNDRTIHRIDNKLLLAYIRTICKDYKLRDRFGHSILQKTMPGLHQKQLLTVSSPNNHQRTQSLNTESKNRKKYLNLTQTSKLDKRSFSSQKNKIQQRTSPMSHRQTHRINTSPQITAFESMLSPMSPRIQEDFRYCINCQLSILSKNVDFHQKHQCQNFAALYQLNFVELTDLVGEKVLKMNKQLKRMLEWLKQKDLSKSRSESICNQTLEKIEEYANENSLNTSLDKTNTDYQKIKASLNNQYIQVVKMTHKLHWFNQVYANLRNQCNKLREKRQTLDLNRFAPAIKPAFQEQRVVPPTPIAQLYPHLHRHSFNHSQAFNQFT